MHNDAGFKNPNGTTAPAGTYGAVTDGRIGVTNASGSHDFGADQYFHVTTANTAPQQLIAPPAFLSDRLEGRSRQSATQTAAESGARQDAGARQVTHQSESTFAPTGLNGGTGDTRVSSSTALPATPIMLQSTAFQVTTQTTTSALGLASVVQVPPTFTGTVFYYLVGALNIPITCSNPPCGSLAAGEITLAINTSLGRATVAANVIDQSGGIANFSTPANSTGIPVTVNGGVVTFNATLDHANFPLSNGSFRCSDCTVANTPGFANQLSFSGTVNGAQATVTVSEVDATGSASITATLQQTPTPNNSAAAIALQRQTGGTDTRSSSYFNVILDASGSPLRVGPLVGAESGFVGSATNTIVGSAPAVGNLVWGKWTGPGALITDSNYATYVTGPGSVQPWITGAATNSIPTSLGTQTYTMIPGASIVNNGTGTMNAATLTAGFLNRTINLNLNATNVGSGNTFQMNAQGLFSPTTARFSQAFNTVSCPGPCTGGAPSGSMAGFFAGPQAEGAGIAFSAGFGGTGTGVTGVVGLKR